MIHRPDPLSISRVSLLLGLGAIACATACATGGDVSREYTDTSDAGGEGGSGGGAGGTDQGGSGGGVAGSAGDGGAGGNVPDDFGQPCAEASDCSSGLCVEGPDGSVCTALCDGPCPEDYDCVKYDGLVSPDDRLCMPQLSRLCRPCSTDEDCVREGVVSDRARCIPYGDQGSFCGVACYEDPCPADYVCENVPVGSGQSERQCVPDAGLFCECRASWAGKGYETACSVTNTHGTCAGTRSCQSGGLSACSAATPAPEACDGADNNCNGVDDEDTCDDSIPCTEDRCTGVGGCDHIVQPGTCVVGTTCVSSGTVNPDNGCEVCDPETSQSGWTQTSGSCDDGLSCTTGDTCTAGTCTGTPVVDAHEPNDASTAATGVSSGDDCDDFPKGSITGTVFGPGDEDWYSYHLDDDYWCWIYPRARLVVPSGSNHDLCAYFVCQDGSTPSVSCVSGTVSNEHGMRGCCSQQGGSATEDAELNHTCNSGSDDSGWVYVRVFNAGASYTCGSYTLEYGDGQI